MREEKNNENDLARLVYDELVLGYSANDIAWSHNIPKKKVLELEKAAEEQFLEETGKSFEMDKGKILARYNNIYQKMYNKGDYKNCKAILDSIAEVKGLTKGDVNVNGTFELDWK